jgi:hypothetical protein
MLSESELNLIEEMSVIFCTESEMASQLGYRLSYFLTLKGMQPEIGLRIKKGKLKGQRLLSESLKGSFRGFSV